MRVSDSMFSDIARSGVGAAKERALEAQRAASSGLRVEKPSDDAVAAGSARRKRAELEHAEAMLKTANQGAFGLSVVDTAFAQMSDVMDRVRELAVQGANATMSSTERANMANEVRSLREQLLSLANTKTDGRYVMNGFREDQPPFDATGAFTGDRNARELEVAPGFRVETSVPVGDVLAPTGGLNVLGMLESLRNSLATNDVAGIQASLNDVETGANQIIDGRARAGAAGEAITMAQSISQRIVDQSKQSISNLVEVDAFDALSELTRSQTALENAVAIAAKLPLPSLVSQAR